MGDIIDEQMINSVLDKFESKFGYRPQVTVELMSEDTQEGIVDYYNWQVIVHLPESIDDAQSAAGVRFGVHKAALKDGVVNLEAKLFQVIARSASQVKLKSGTRTDFSIIKWMLP